MQRIIASLAVGLSVLALAAWSHATYYTGSGARSSFRSQSGVPLGTILAPNNLTVRISPAQAGTVLTVEVTIFLSAATNDVYPYFNVYTSAGFVEPVATGAYRTGYCEVGSPCVVTANYWIDIDKAEIDMGGGVIGAPLNVQLLLSDYYSSPGGSIADISLAARLENKN
jgi:hypothetical protein